MHVTSTSARRREIFAAIETITWTDGATRPELIGDCVTDPISRAGQPSSRCVGLARLSGGRRLVGLDFDYGTRVFILSHGCEAIHVLTDYSPHHG